MKNIVILGSTGSIGQSALRVIEANAARYRVVGLTAHRNTALLIEQANRFSPLAVAVTDKDAAEAVRAAVTMPVYEGPEGIERIAAMDEGEFVISAIVGSHGLKPTLAAIDAGRAIGLANKETLVMAGEFVMERALAKGVRILPIDSEHSAIYQCLEGRDRSTVKKLILTASGGPFIGKTEQELQGVTLEAALKHPSWTMGRKITIDSATLMNKGLEVIEAYYLFGVWPRMIDVVVHPQSIIHSMVEFIDGSCLAQLSVPDMRSAIAYAMSYPQRIADVIPQMNLAAVGALTFSEPDKGVFRCLQLAYDALAAGGTMPCALNAANEVAVEAFLNRRIKFMDIPAVIQRTMDAHDVTDADEIEVILEVHRWTTEVTTKLIEAIK